AVARPETLRAALLTPRRETDVQDASARRVRPVPQSREEVLARADRHRLRAARPADRLLAVERDRAVHLHALLGHECRTGSSASRPTTTTRPRVWSSTIAWWRRRRKSGSPAGSTTRRFRRTPSPIA